MSDNLLHIANLFEQLHHIQCQLRNDSDIEAPLFCLVDQQGYLQRFSSRWYQDLGWTEDKDQSASWLEWFDGSDQRSGREFLHTIFVGLAVASTTSLSAVNSTCASDGRSWVGRLTDSWGKQRWFIWHCIAATPKHCLLKATEATKVDPFNPFTDQAPTEAAFAALAELPFAESSANRPIAIASLEGRLLRISAAFAQRLGYSLSSLDERSQTTWAQLLDCSAIEQVMRQLLVEQPSPFCYRLRYRTSQGDWADYPAQLTLVRTATGLPSHGVLQLLDLPTELPTASTGQSPQRYEELISWVNGIFWEADAQTFQFTFVNSKAEEILGYPVADWLTKPRFWLDHLHPDDVGWVPTHCQNATRSLKDHQVEYRMIAADGRTVWLQDLIAVEAVNGQPLKLRGVMIDITARKQAQHSLYESERHLRLITDALPVGIAYIDVQQRYQFINKTYEQWLGLERSHMRGQTVQHVLGDDAYQLYLPHIQLALAGQQASIECDFPYADGTSHFVSINLIPNRVGAQTEGFFVLMYDLSDRKQAEEALKASEERFFKAFHASPDPTVIITFDDEHFVEVNDSFLETLGYSRDEVIGYTSLDIGLWVEPTVRTQMQTQLAKQGTISNQEVLYYTKQRSRRTFLLSAELVQLNGQVCILAVSKDISDRKLAEDRLHQQMERERMVADITQRIRQSLSLDVILNTTVDEVCQSLKADRVVVYRFLPDWSGKVVVESVRAGVMSILGQPITDFCFQNNWQTLYQQGRTRAVNDIFDGSIQPCHAELLAQFQVKANLVVPILQGESLWGLLIAHQCSRPRQWQPTEISFMKQLGSQLAIAIQQSELFEQVRQLNTTLEQQVQSRTDQLRQAYDFEATLKRITDRVRDSLDENQILQSAVEELGHTIGLRTCNAALYDLEQFLSQINYEYTTLDVPFQGYTMSMANFQQGYDQLLNGQYFQFCSLYPSPKRGHVAMLACPIQDDQGVLGDLWLINDVGYAFTEQDIRLTQQVANQCAIAIRQAQLYHQAQSQVEELERLNQLKDDFLSTVSHELRTPMSNIKMATQMLEINLARMGLFDLQQSSIKQYFQILKDEGEREISLINDLLDLSRLDAGSEPLVLETIDPFQWLTHIAEPFIKRAANQQQRFLLDLSNPISPLTTDLSYLERIFTELFNNACKYTPAGEQIRVCAISVWPSDRHHAAAALHISVTNTGVHIPAEECDRMFEKFYRIPNNDPWKHGGTGLGLALVKKLVEHLNATIEVETVQNSLTFILKFPLTP